MEIKILFCCLILLAELFYFIQYVPSFSSTSNHIIALLGAVYTRFASTNFEKRLIGNVCEELVMANMGHRYEDLHIKINSKSDLH